MGFTGVLVGEYLGYCVGIAIVAKLCVGLRVAVLQREMGGSNSESSMRAYLLRGSLKVRIFACLGVQLFCVFYTGMHAKVSPYYLYPLARMSNPVLTSPVLNPCILTNTTYMQTYCERSPRLEGAEFSCNLDGGWPTHQPTYPSAYDACIAARLQNGYQSNGWSAFMVSVNVLLFVVLYEIRVTKRVVGGARPRQELCEDLLVVLAACGWYAMPALIMLGSQGIFTKGVPRPAAAPSHAPPLAACASSLSCSCPWAFNRRGLCSSSSKSSTLSRGPRASCCTISTSCCTSAALSRGGARHRLATTSSYRTTGATGPTTR